MTKAPRSHATTIFPVTGETVLGAYVFVTDDVELTFPDSTPGAVPIRSFPPADAGVFGRSPSVYRFNKKMQ
ncbi:hypothetical protein EMIT07CA2_150010 [Brevibacillus sp. IT-7CA2]